MKKILYAISLLAIIGVCNTGWGFAISDTHLTITPKKPVTKLVVTNDSLQKKLMRVIVTPQRMVQNGKKISYIKAGNVLAVPRAFTLKPNQKQVVRVAIKKALPNQNYRILVTNINPTPRLVTTNGGIILGAVRINYQYGVSVKVNRT